MPVFAGLMPINTTTLQVLNTGNMCTFFNGWMTNLLGNPKYALEMEIDDCQPKNNCTSMFLPGGIELARKVQAKVNTTMFKGGAFEGAESIRIYNAPGFAMRFDRLGQDFEFDRQEECTYYGIEDDDIIQICSRDIESSIAVGKWSCFLGEWWPTPTSSF